METITDVIEKKDTFSHFLKLIPTINDEYKDRIATARAYWNTLTITKQRQIYYEIREQIKRGETLNPNPFFLIKDCTPVPTNWNGRQGINEKMKREKMVSAKYKPSAKYGVYTLKEARLFEMTDIKPLNY